MAIDFKYRNKILYGVFVYVRLCVFICKFYLKTDSNRSRVRNIFLSIFLTRDKREKTFSNGPFWEFYRYFYKNELANNHSVV